MTPQLQKMMDGLLDAIAACQKDRDGGYDALASAWWDVVCETAEEMQKTLRREALDELAAEGQKLDM